MNQKGQQLDKVTLQDKIVQVNRSELMQFQVWYYCTFMNKIILNHTELMMLSLVGEMGKVLVIDFCKEVVRRNILSTPQAAQTALSRLYRVSVLKKEGTGKKTIYLDPDAQILSQGDIAIIIKIVYNEPNPAERTSAKNSKALEPA